MKLGLKKHARLLLGIGISALLLWQVLTHVDAASLQALWAQARVWPLLWALAAVCLGFALRAWRWHSMLRPLAPQLPFARSAAVFLSSFALNNTLPLRAGDVARTLMYSQELQTPPASLAATLVVERLLDAATLLLLFFVGLWLLPPDALPAAWQPYIQQAGRVFSVMAALGVLTLFVLPHALHRWPALTQAKGGKLRQVLAQFAQTLAVLRSPWLLGQLLLLSLLSWLVEGCVFWAAAQALGLDLGGYGPWFALGMATLATLIPGTPGHLGTFDYFAVQAFAVYGVNASHGAGLALLVHLLLWLPVTLVGGALLLRSQGFGALARIQDLEKKG